MTRKTIATVFDQIEREIELAKKLEQESDELEAILDALVDELPPMDDSIESRWRFLLGQFADANLHLKNYYKELVGVK